MTTLLQRAREKAKSVCPSVSTVGSQAQFGPDAIEDIFPGCGPLAGIHAALRSSHSELNLVLAVDIPFVETRFLEYLLREAHHSGAAVVVPRVAGGWQPLCAVYRPKFAEVAEAALDSGRCKIDALFNQLQIRIVINFDFRFAGYR